MVEQNIGLYIYIYIYFKNQNETLEIKVLREKNAAEIISSNIFSGKNRNGQHAALKPLLYLSLVQ